MMILLLNNDFNSKCVGITVAKWSDKMNMETSIELHNRPEVKE